MREDGPVVARVGTAITLYLNLRNQMRFLQRDGFTIQCVCDDDDWADRLRDMGFVVRPLGMGRRPSLWAMARWGAQLRRELRRRPVDIIHFHNAFHGLVGRYVARRAGVPVVVQTVHNWYYLDRSVRGRFFRLLERRAARYTDALFFINREDYDRAVAERLIANARRYFIGNGVDVDGFLAELERADRASVRSELGLDDDEVAIIMVARLEPPKDHETLLRAFAAVRSKGARVRLLLVGHGLATEQVRALARSLGVEREVWFAGRRHDVPALMAASDVVVLSTLHEGFGRVLVEGALAGKPVVASDVTGTREVVEHRVTGLLVPPRDADALAAALSAVIENDEYARDLARAGHEYAKRSFDERDPARLVGLAYRELLDSAS